MLITDTRDVGQLPIGIEWEFGLEWVDAECDCDPDLEECDCEYYGYSNANEGRAQNAVDDLEDWRFGWDECYEVRSNPTHRLDEGYDRLIRLIDTLEEYNPEYGSSGGCLMGMHVHLNVADERMPLLDVGCVFDTYMESYQQRAADLVLHGVRASRIDQQLGRNTELDYCPNYYSPISAELRWDDILRANQNRKLATKGWDISPRVLDYIPTVEIRIWDSTDDRKNLKERFDLLTDLARDAVILQHERGIETYRRDERFRARGEEHITDEYLAKVKVAA